MMAEFVCKFADLDGRVQEQVESAESEDVLRQRYGDRGLLLYSVKPRRALRGLQLETLRRRGGRLNLEQFLIFNRQFVTLTRAGLPILKSLELLAANTKNRRLGGYLDAIRGEVKTGTPLSEAFRRQGVFPPIYTTSLMAGEKSGSLPDVIDRYVQYQKLALGVRKKILVSLIYPCVLVTLVLTLVVFLVTYVVPEFATLYNSMDAQLPYMTELLVAFGVTVSENLFMIAGVLLGIAVLAAAWMRSKSVRTRLDRLKIKIPLFGAIWDQVSSVPALPPAEHTVGRRHSTAAGARNDRRIAGAENAAAGGQRVPSDGEGRPIPVAGHERRRHLPVAGDRDGPCWGVDRRVAGNAELCCRILRRRRQHADGGGF